MKNTKKGQAGLKLGHRQLREALMRTLGIDERHDVAFNSRLRRTIGLLETRSPAHHRRTPNKTYGVSDLMECALALQMQRGFVDPAVSAAVVIGRRPVLHEAWRRAIVKRDDYLLQVALDAFAEMVSPAADQNGPPVEASLGRSHATNLLPMLTINVGELADRAMRALEAMDIVTPYELLGAMLKPETNPDTR